MILSFRKIDPATIARHLATLLDKDSIGYSTDALQLVAREAKGSLRDALSLLEQVLALGQHKIISLDSARAALSVMGEGLCQNIFVGILQKDPQQCLEAVSEIDASSLDYSQILDLTSQLFRSAIVLKQAGSDKTKRERANELLNLLPTELEFISRESESISIAALIEIYRVLAQASRDILRTNSQKAWAEVVLMDCMSRAEWLSAEELLGVLSHSDIASDAPLRTTTPSHSRPVTTATKPNSTEIQAVGNMAPQPASAVNKSLVQSFSELVGIIQQQSVQLAVKLKHAKIESFTPQRLVFSDCPENKLFAQLTTQEAEIFFSALRTLGCENCQLEGILLPKNFSQNALTKAVAPGVTAQREDKDATAPSLAQKTVFPQPSGGRSAPQSTSDAVKNLIREDPFGNRPQKSDNQKKNEANIIQPEGGVSLASIEQAEESRKWKARQEDIKNRPIIKKLESLGAEIEVLPLKHKERSR